MSFVIRDGLYTDQVFAVNNTGTLNFLGQDGTLMLSIDSLTGSVIVPEHMQSLIDVMTPTKELFNNNGGRQLLITQQTAFVIPYTETDGSVSDLWRTSSATLSESKINLGCCGTQTAALAFGGYTSSYTMSSVTEKFNGSNWSTSGSMSNAGVSVQGVGHQNAALSFAGGNSYTYRFNGSNWSLVTGATGLTYTDSGSVGKQNHALNIGGGSYITTLYEYTYRFDGFTWMRVGDVSVARSNPGAFGIGNSAIVFGGQTGESTASAVVEKFNALVWATKVSLNEAHSGSVGCGLDATYGMRVSGFGSGFGYSTTSERFNSEFWVVTTGLNMARANAGGAGSQSSALVVAGDFESTYRNTTELFTSVTSQQITLDRFTLATTDMWKTHAATLTQARAYVGGVGTQNAALCLGGDSTNTDAVDKFNGNAWSATDALSANRFAMAGIGIQNNALSVGGHTTSTTVDPTRGVEGYNGYTWSSKSSYPASRSANMGSAGKANAAICFGGFSDTLSPKQSAYVATFDGTTWSATASFVSDIAKHKCNGVGTQTVALCIGGFTDSAITVVEKYNGNAWSLSGMSPLVTARYDAGASGTATNAFIFGGYNQSTCEHYNSGVWYASGAQLNAIRYGMPRSSQGSSGNAVTFGGYAGVSTTDRTEQYHGLAKVNSKVMIIDKYDKYETEEQQMYIRSESTINVDYCLTGNNSATELTDLTILNKIEDNYWTVTASLNEAKDSVGTAGVQNAALCFGGYVLEDVYVDTTEKFNGISWSTVADLTASKKGVGFAGVQNAALCFGGYEENAADIAITERFNGDAWAQIYGGNIPTARQNMGSVGTSFAATLFGGWSSGSRLASTATFNGFVWTTASTLPSSVGLVDITGFGSTKAAIGVGGSSNTEYVRSATIEFNGSAWTTLSATLNMGRSRAGSSGVKNNAIVFGGSIDASPYYSTASEVFNGSVWTMHTDLNTAAHTVDICGTGSCLSSLAIGGNDGSTSSSSAVEKRGHSAQINAENYGMALCGKSFIVI